MNKKIYLIFLFVFTIVNPQENQLDKIVQLNKFEFDYNFKLSKSIFLDDDSVIVCGVNNLNKLELLKLNSDLNLDKSFAKEGKLIINPFESHKLEVHDIIFINKNEEIFISGVSYFNNQTKAIIFKITKDGKLEFISIIPKDNLKKVKIFYSTKHNKVFVGLITNDLQIIQLNRYGEVYPTFKSLYLKNIFDSIITTNVQGQFFVVNEKKNHIEIIQYDQDFKPNKDFGINGQLILQLLYVNNIHCLKHTKDIVLGFNQRKKYTILKLKTDGTLDEEFNHEGFGKIEKIISKPNDNILLLLNQKNEFQIIELSKKGKVL